MPRKKGMALGLEGTRIIQTASFAAGPMAGRLLADWGADVIFVDHPKGIRVIQMAAYGVGPMAQSQVSLLRRPIESAATKKRMPSDIDYFSQNHNRNKRSITLNLSLEAGREIIYKLLEKSDVLLSNFRPYELEKFKLEYETLSQLNPRLICANLTACGRKGPDRNEPGGGAGSGDARSGFLHVTQGPGMEPVQMPGAYADHIVGLSLAFGIMTALFIRERTGVGQEVDVSLFSTGVFANSTDIAGCLVTGQDRQAVRRKDLASPLTNNYQTKDGRWLRLSVTEAYWSRFCRAVGREDLEHDPRFESPVSRAENHLSLFDIVEELLLSRTLHEWGPLFKKAGVPWAPMQTLPEVINDPQARANDFFLPYDHPTYGHIEVVANPVKLSRTPETIRMPAPEYGQHTEEILLEYGYTWEDIERFRQQGVIA